MASLTTELFGVPSTVHQSRCLDAAGERAADFLAGRTVWFATGYPAGSVPVKSLRSHLGWGDVVSESLELAPDEPLRRLGTVAADDVVVLDHPLMTMLADALRDCGTHVLLHTDAWDYVSAYTGPVDAYLVAEPSETGHHTRVERVTTFMPSPALAAAKDVPAADEPSGDHPRDIGWICAVAEVVRGDRDENVGGRLHPRPAVPPR